PSAVIAVTMVTPVAKVPSALRKSRGSIVELSLASSLAGSAGCLGASDIHLASERQVFGRQTKSYTSIIGSRRIEVECEVRIHRVRIAKLALQGTGREQTAGAARCEQQRHCLGAQVHRKGAIAPQSRLGRDIRNVAAPRICHRIDAVRA